MSMEQFGNKLGDSIRKILEQYREKDYLVVNRQMIGSFYHIFADAIYNYETGIIIVERFFPIQNAEPINARYRTLNKQDAEKAKKIKEELRSILATDILGVDEEGKAKLQERINELSEESKNIVPDASALKMYKYKNLPLNRMALYNEGEIASLSQVYASFVMSATMFLGMQNPMDYELMVSTMDYDDYTDLIVIPIKKE